MLQRSKSKQGSAVINLPFGMASWSAYLSTAKKSCLFLFFALTIARTSQAYFGLSSKEPISEFLLTERSTWEQPMVYNNKELCTSFHLHPRQRKACRKSGMAQTLFEAIRLSATECRIQFEYYRWNCSLDSTRISLLEKVFKETSLLYAISSASLVHTISRACSRGLLQQCSCDKSLNDKENRKAWLWGGCGDNIASGQKEARRFLHHKTHTNNDLRALVDRHNSEVGIRVVKDLIVKKCKCHGVSGACTVETCWKQLAPFKQVGETLRAKYDNAVEGNANTNEANSRPSKTARHPVRRSHPVRPKKQKRPKARSKKKKKKSKTEFGASSKELVYLDRSPDFCTKSKYSPGTSGRICIRGGNCAELCCGRGHNVQVRNVTKSCHCEMIRIYQVKCQKCTSEIEVYTCK